MVKTEGRKQTAAIKPDSDQIAASVVRGIQEKKGHDIIVLDLRSLGSTIADIFVICHGESDTQVEAIARSVEEQVEKELFESPAFKEGVENAEWILLDYINVVVHIFNQEQREFYGLENFWADANIRHIA